MRSDVIRRPRVARPRRDTIAVSIPKTMLWLGGAVALAFGGLMFSLGLWIGGEEVEAPPVTTTRVALVPTPPPVEKIEEPPPSEVAEKPVAPVETKKIALDMKEKQPRGKHGIQLGAFPDKREARSFLELNAESLKSYPIYLLPAKVGSKGTWYRVRVGSFVTKDEAEAARSALPDDVAKGSMVVRYQ